MASSIMISFNSGIYVSNLRYLEKRINNTYLDLKGQCIYVYFNIYLIID